MVLLAMMLFGLMAMAALVIDLGFARLAQRQMQTAVDAAALEGLRYRDELPPGYQEMPHEIARRENARDFAAWVFDDDFDTVSDSRQFGAGPIIEFTGGVGAPSLFASQLMEVPEVPVYKPGDDGSDTTSLQLNLGDDITGDMVSGRYAPEPPEDATREERARFHQERSDYSRDDFPSPVATTTSYPTFLVRMRRTGEEFDPAGGSGSAGPTIPYFFGRGSLLNRQTVGAGISARATALAALQPVVCVGAEVTSPRRTGFIGVAFTEGAWRRDDLSNPIEMPVQIYALGDEVSNTGSTGNVTDNDGYAAIITSINGADRIIGFGFVEKASSQYRRKIINDTMQVAHDNASARFCKPLNTEDLGDVLRAQRELIEFSEQRNDQWLLLAPVSAR